MDGKKIAELPVYCKDNRKSRFNLVHEIVYRFKNLINLWIKVNIIDKK